MLFPKSGRVLVSFWEAIPELCKWQFISSHGSPHRGPGQRAYETHRSAISEPEAALLSWHLHGSVFLLKVQGQDEVPGLSFAPQAKL